MWGAPGLQSPWLFSHGTAVCTVMWFASKVERQRQLVNQKMKDENNIRLRCQKTAKHPGHTGVTRCSSLHYYQVIGLQVTRKACIWPLTASVLKELNSTAIHILHGKDKNIGCVQGSLGQSDPTRRRPYAFRTAHKRASRKRARQKVHHTGPRMPNPVLACEPSMHHLAWAQEIISQVWKPIVPTQRLSRAMKRGQVRSLTRTNKSIPQALGARSNTLHTGPSALMRSMYLS